MPPVGLPLYWLFGIARIDSQAVRLMEKAAQKVMGGLVDLHGKSLTEKPEGFIDKDEVPHAWHYLVNPGSSITGRCMLEGNDLTVLHNGEAAYPVMLKAISEAKERVFLSSFHFRLRRSGQELRRRPARRCRTRMRRAPAHGRRGLLPLVAELAQTPRPGRQARLLPAAAPHPAPVFHQPADAPQSPDLRQRNRLHRRHEHFPEPPRQPEAPLTGAGRALPLLRPHRAAA